MTIQERIAQLEAENKSLRLGIELNKSAKHAGFEIDQRKLKIHTDAICYQEQNNCDYQTALKAVS